VIGVVVVVTDTTVAALQINMYNLKIKAVKAAA
jgi:hypothetical protein